MEGGSLHNMGFSVEEELLFCRRFDEGYDLVDSRYEAWLQVNYPEAITEGLTGPSMTPCGSPPDLSEITGSSLSGPPQTPYSSPSGLSEITGSSLSGPPLTPRSSSFDPPQTPRSSLSGPPQTRRSSRPKVLHQSLSGPSETTRNSSCGPCTCPRVAPRDRSSGPPSGGSPDSPANSHGSLSHFASSSITQGSSSVPKKSSPLSSLLTLPVRTDKPKKTGKARVLTSDECLQILKDKERKKQEEAEMKIQRLEERLRKKKLKEEEQKRKNEEKVQKKAEREATKALQETAKEAAKAQREAAKVHREAAKAEKEASKLRKAQAVKDKGKRKAQDECETSGRSKKARFTVDTTVCTDICCVCSGNFEDDTGTGREWLQCKCGRWIHEDCIDFEDSSAEGLCPLC